MQKNVERRIWRQTMELNERELKIRILKFMRDRNIQQKQIADKLEMNWLRLHRMLAVKGKIRTPLSFDTYFKICKLLDVNPSYFMYE